MKKVSKVFALVLMLAFVLTSVLSGCGSKAPAETTPSDSTAEATAAEATKAEESTTEVAVDKKISVGYVVSTMNHEWYMNIVNGAKEEAKRLDIDLKLADANMDVTAQINACENFIAQKVDVLIVTPVDANAVAPVIKKAKDAGIKVATESNIVEGADTFVGITNKAAAKNVGLWFADYAKKNNLDPKILIVGLPAFEDCRQRVEGFKEGMDEGGLKYAIVQEVDGQGDKEKSLVASTDALTAHKDVNVIFGINDNSTTGGMAAYKAAGLDESKLVAIGFGFEGKVGQEALISGGPYKAACAMFPQFVGVGVINAAVALANGETLPAHYETPTAVMTADVFPNFYTKNGENYDLNFDAVRELLKK